MNVVEKEIDPASNTYTSTFVALDSTFTIVFLVELLINFYGCGGPHKKMFWNSGWNLFDTVIVVVGVIIMSGANLGSFQKLKLLRAFRVLRLGKRIESLNQSTHTLAIYTRGCSRCTPSICASLLKGHIFRVAPPAEDPLPHFDSQS